MNAITSASDSAPRTLNGARATAFSADWRAIASAIRTPASMVWRPSTVLITLHNHPGFESGSGARTINFPDYSDTEMLQIFTQLCSDNAYRPGEGAEARVAARISTLDLLSRGRVELGLGESATTPELHPFDVRFRSGVGQHQPSRVARR